MLTANAPPPPLVSGASRPIAAARASQTSLRASTTQTVPPPALAEDEGLAGLYELAEQAQAAPTQVESIRCPQCSSKLDDDAVLCTHCGYDTRTGQALAGATVQPPVLSYRPAGAIAKANKKKQPVDLMAPTGAFAVGLAASAISALLVSTVWIAFAWGTGYSLSLIAVVIGVAAGAGMHIGQKGYSSAGGYAASGITLLAILLAKITYVEMLLARQGFHRSILDLDRAKLVYFLFSPIGMIIMLVGMGAAYRTANGSIAD